MTKKNQILLILAITLSVPLLIVATLFAATFHFNGKTIPSQKYLDKNISGLSYQELNSKLSLLDNKLNQTQATLVHEDESTKVFLEELIQDPSHEEVLKSTLFYKGRPTIAQLLKDSFNSQKYYPNIELDQSQATEAISSKLQNLTPTLNASIDKNGQIIDSQDGLSIDMENLQNQLENYLTKKDIINVDTISTQAEVTSKDLSPFQANIDYLKENSLTLLISDKEYELSLFDNLDQIEFSRDENESIQVNLSTDFITNYLNRVVRPDIKIEPGKLTLTYNEETEKVDFESDSTKGVDLNVEGSIDAVNLAIQSQIFSAQQNPIYLSTIDLEPTLEIDPVLKEQGVTELIETGYTTFRGSTYNRITNINVGMATFNGLIIQPDEEFSFNENLGPVDASTGYVPELVIKSIGTIPEYGGGLCQVSSTMYRAALMSGLEITERDNHSYAVSYYAQVLGHGLDATIYPGVKDLKFINNTGYPIVVQAYAEGTSAYFKFYGTKHIDRVELVGPVNSNYRSPGPQSVTVNPNLPAGTVKVMDNPVTGFDSYWQRIIYDKDNNKTTEDIFSDYRAVNSKLVVSPDYYDTKEEPSTPESI